MDVKCYKGRMHQLPVSETCLPKAPPSPPAEIFIKPIDDRLREQGMPKKSTGENLSGKSIQGWRSIERISFPPWLLCRKSDVGSAKSARSSLLAVTVLRQCNVYQTSV